MPSVELSKLPGINPVRALATGDPPPVDAERVQEIRNALRDGSYPLVPAKIADAMIAAQVSLSLPDRN